MSYKKTIFFCFLLYFNYSQSETCLFYFDQNSKLNLIQILRSKSLKADVFSSTTEGSIFVLYDIPGYQTLSSYWIQRIQDLSLNINILSSIKSYASESRFSFLEVGNPNHLNSRVTRVNDYNVENEAYLLARSHQRFFKSLSILPLIVPSAATGLILATGSDMYEVPALLTMVFGSFSFLIWNYSNKVYQKMMSNPKREIALRNSKNILEIQSYDIYQGTVQFMKMKGSKLVILILDPLYESYFKEVMDNNSFEKVSADLFVQNFL